MDAAGQAPGPSDGQVPGTGPSAAARPGRQAAGESFARLAGVVARLRHDCPWDAQQTHLSLVKHLVEESSEAVDAIEDGSPDDLREELGDLLIQVVFHAVLAQEDGWFSLDQVAQGAADKLVARHPYVFGEADVPGDLMGSWEAAKRVEKQRASCLDGIPGSMNALARAAKVAARVRDTHLDGKVPLPAGSLAGVDAAGLGEALLALACRAQAAGLDPDQALRGALRTLEQRVRAAEAARAEA